ncbi:exopolysaccharide production protein ExoZ [Duganella sp. CF402]|uniref:acyltransferase family protein n=1 Tax=unclassified Duganella TaxID=2636909 RepID=UPI0008C6F0F0|nr:MULTISPECIES: acyltransferase [unclassified Duganella]RZT04593.1 exopolysaccharide production protein ExoZ [Duganella sp. BK701]SEM30935.1 exopolysaccharide production protein ExoZ [Duganella sp. CF402]
MFYNGIHALRAIAALLVVLHHAFQRGNALGLTQLQFEFGAWGVDLFFVISGFVMAKGVQGRQGWQAASGFIGRRLARVVPLYWAATLLLTMVYFVLPQLFGNLSIAPGDLPRSLLFWPYEDGRGLVRPIVSQGWTLIFEMFFYALVCLGLLLGRGRAMRLTAGLIAGLIAAGYALAWDGGKTPFILSGILVEFLFGALVFHLTAHAQRLGSAQRWALALAGVGFSFALADLASLGLGRGLAGGLGAFAVVLAAAGWRLPRLPYPLHLLGDASYAIYLFHGMGFSLTGKLLGVAHWPSAALAVLALTLGATACGIAVHLLVEKRLQHYAIVSLTRIGVIA